MCAWGNENFHSERWKWLSSLGTIYLEEISDNDVVAGKMLTMSFLRQS